VFRLARIEHATVLDCNFDPSEHLVDKPGEPLFVQVLFRPEIARSVREPLQAMLLEQEETEEGVHMTLLTQSDQDTVRWLLSWGSDARVVEPVWLQALLSSHAEQELRNYRNG
jgi:predicted DNA-binding transcriptional regulator YafY